MMLQTFAIFCVLSVVCNYSLEFRPDRDSVIGGLDLIGLSDIGAMPHPAYAPTVSYEAFMFFQMLLAAFTPALIARAFNARMKFGAAVLFASL